MRFRNTMAEKHMPKNFAKARRGGYSLGRGCRLLKKQSQMRRKSNNARDNRSRGHDQETPLDSTAQQDGRQITSPSGDPPPLSRDHSHSPTAMDDPDEDVDEQAAALLSRFLIRSSSRPGSSGNPSAVARKSPEPVNPVKPAVGAVKNDLEPILPTEHLNGDRTPQSPEQSNKPNEDKEEEAMHVVLNEVMPTENTNKETSPISHKGYLKDRPPQPQHAETLSEPSQSSIVPPAPEPSTEDVANGNSCLGDISFTGSQRTTQHPTNTVHASKRLDPSTPGPSPSQSPSGMDQMRSRKLHGRAMSNSPPLVTENQPVRRSARSRAGPINYYAPKPGFRGHGDSEGDEGSRGVCRSPDEPRRQEKSHPPSAVHQPRNKHRLAYQSDSIRIIWEPLETSFHGVEDRIPYCSSVKRQNLAEHCRTIKFPECDEYGYLLHQDFSVREMNALSSILGYPCSGDTLAQVHLTRAVRKRCSPDKKSSTNEKAAILAGQISLLCKLNEALVPCEKELASFLVEHRRGDFSGSRMLKERKIEKIYGMLKELLAADVVRRGNAAVRLQKLLGTVEEDRLLKLADQCKQASIHLKNRKRKDLCRFLVDAMEGLLSVSSSVLRAIPADSRSGLDSLGYDASNFSTLLRTRELGYAVHKGMSSVRRTLNDATAKWETYKSWKGASGDVLVLSWSPDGTRFAAGAAAQCDEQNMQYNRNNNLLLGDLTSSRLKELPDHRVPRPRSGSHSIVDPNLYMSVSAVNWSTCGDFLYTASYDETVKVWDVSNHSDATCMGTFRHPGKVQVMAVSDFENGFVATGSESDPCFRLWNMSNNRYPQSFPLKTIGHKVTDMTPTCIAWGSTFYSKNLLAAGMSGRDSDVSGNPPRTGRLALWQVAETDAIPLNISPSSENVFDLSWNPAASIFAIGVPAGRSKGLGRETRTHVRTYDPSISGYKAVVQEYDCPALDINDVSFCPSNSAYVTASCTDGVTYVWDHRNPNYLLHKLRHGAPIQELDSSLTREQADVGVRLALWGEETTQFYTGSSDGRLKKWNILLPTEDAMVEDVATFGQEIMSGVFSPDKHNMLVGDSCGGLHVLSTAPWSRTLDDDTSLILERADGASGGIENGNNGEGEGGDNGSANQEANRLLASRKLVRHPEFGVGQGPCYDGPYAAWARPEGTVDFANTPLDREVQAQQFSAPPVKRRKDLDKATREHVELQMHLAKIRNRQEGESKRKRQASASPSSQLRRRPPASMIDLTGNDDIKIEPVTPKKSKQVLIDLTQSGDESDDIAPEGLQTSIHFPPATNGIDSADEWIEEDHWWPVNVDPNFDNDDT